MKRRGEGHRERERAIDVERTFFRRLRDAEIEIVTLRNVPSTKQMALEKMLISKTKIASTRSSAEVIMVGGQVTLYTNSSDCYFYVVGGSDANELVLANVLETLYDSVTNLLKYVCFEKVTSRERCDNLSLHFQNPLVPQTTDRETFVT